MPETPARPPRPPVGADPHLTPVENAAAYKQRKQEAQRTTAARALLTRELRIIEGADSITISAVEVSSMTGTWRSTSRVLTIYQVDRRMFLEDPGSCLAAALDAITAPLLVARTVEGTATG